MGARTLTAVIDRESFQLGLPLRLLGMVPVKLALCLTLELLKLLLGR